MRVLPSTLLFLAMRTFMTLTLGLALLSSLSTAHADTKIVNFTANPMESEVSAQFDDFTVWGSQGVSPRSLTSNPFAGLGVDSSTSNGALEADEVITFEFAPVPARRIVLKNSVVTPGFVHVRLRTTEGLQSFVFGLDASDPIDTASLAYGKSIVSIAIEPADAVLFVRQIEHDALRFAPGDRLRFDNLGGDPKAADHAYFYGVAGMTLELERIGGVPGTQGLVTIRRADGVDEGHVVLTGKSKSSLPLRSNGWFEWTYEPADATLQEIEVQTRAVFKKKDAKVTYTTLIDEFRVPSIAGMMLDASVTATGGAHNLTFEGYDGGSQWYPLTKLTAAKKGVLKIAPFEVENAGVLLLDADGANTGQMITITFTRTAPAFDKSTAPIVDIDG